MSTKDSNISYIFGLTDRSGFIFGLANPSDRGQTDTIMKNFPGTAIICAAIILGVSGILISRGGAPKLVPPTSSEIFRRFGLELSEREALAEPDKPFCSNLQEHVTKSALYSFDVSHENGEHDKPRCENVDLQKLTVKVDAITKFRRAEGSANSLTPIGSHVTQRIYSDKPEDIQAVLALLKH